MASRIQVSVRVRPLVGTERDAHEAQAWEYTETQLQQIHSRYAKEYRQPDGSIKVEEEGINGELSINHTLYAFDNVFAPDCKNSEVYSRVVAPVVDKVVDGYNGTVFAYGQTSSGKTHTMQGKYSDPGLIQRALENVFARIRDTPDREFLLHCSYFEIYNEQINDLLVDDNTNLRVFSDSRNGVAHVENLTDSIVKNYDEILALLHVGEERRAVGSTTMNSESSRSHTVVRLVVESHQRDESGNGRLASHSLSSLQSETGPRSPHPPHTMPISPVASRSPVRSPRGAASDGAVQSSVLYLVDLAGSERLNKTNAEGSRRKEGIAINKSLLTLGTVINRLSKDADKPVEHVPFRESKLTQILQHALGGNSMTSIIATVTPAASNCDETHMTLKFAMRAKSVRTQASQNKVMDEKSKLQQYRQEIDQLKWRLEQEQRLHEQALEQQRAKTPLQAADVDADSDEKRHENKVRVLQDLLDKIKSNIIVSERIAVRMTPPASSRGRPRSVSMFEQAHRASITSFDRAWAAPLAMTDSLGGRATMGRSRPASSVLAWSWDPTDHATNTIAEADEDHTAATASTDDGPDDETDGVDDRASSTSSPLMQRRASQLSMISSASTALSLRAENDALGEQLRAAGIMLVEIGVENDRLTAENENLQADLQDKSHRLMVAEARLKKTGADAAGDADSVVDPANAAAIAEAATARAVEAERKLQRAEARVAELEDRMDSIHMQMAEEAGQGERVLRARSKSIAELEDERDQLTDGMEALQMEVLRLQDSTRIAKSELTRVEAERDQLRDEVHRLEQQQSTELHRTLALSSSAEKLQQHLDDLKRRHEEAEREEGSSKRLSLELKKTRNELEFEKATLEAELAAKDKKLQRLAGELAEYTTLLERTATKFAGKKRENTELRVAVEKLMNRVTEQEDQLRSQAQRYDETIARLDVQQQDELVRTEQRLMEQHEQAMRDVHSAVQQLHQQAASMLDRASDADSSTARLDVPSALAELGDVYLAEVRRQQVRRSDAEAALRQQLEQQRNEYEGRIAVLTTQVRRESTSSVTSLGVQTASTSSGVSVSTDDDAGRDVNAAAVRSPEHSTVLKQMSALQREYFLTLVRTAVQERGLGHAAASASSDEVWKRVQHDRIHWSRWSGLVSEQLDVLAEKRQARQQHQQQRQQQQLQRQQVLQDRRQHRPVHRAVQGSSGASSRSSFSSQASTSSDGLPSFRERLKQWQSRAVEAEHDEDSTPMRLLPNAGSISNISVLQRIEQQQSQQQGGEQSLHGDMLRRQSSLCDQDMPQRRPSSSLAGSETVSMRRPSSSLAGGETISMRRASTPMCDPTPPRFQIDLPISEGDVSDGSDEYRGYSESNYADADEGYDGIADEYAAGEYEADGYDAGNNSNDEDDVLSMSSYSNGETAQSTPVDDDPDCRHGLRSSVPSRPLQPPALERPSAQDAEPVEKAVSRVVVSSAETHAAAAAASATSPARRGFRTVLMRRRD